MKRILSLKLAFILLLASLSPLSVLAQESSCENGECIEGIVHKIQDLSAVYKQQCMPKNESSEKELKEFYESHGIKESCVRIMREINALDAEVQKHQIRLESHLGCENGECKIPGSPSDDLSSQVSKITKDLTCSEEKKKAINDHCARDRKSVV